MKLELEGTATKRIAAREMESSMSVEGMVATTAFGVKRVFSGIVLGSFLVVSKNFFGCCNIHEFLLSHLLLFLVGELVRMPFQSQSLVSFLNLFLGGTSLDAKDFVIISLASLLLEFLSFSHPLFGSREAFIFLQCSSEVVESLVGK